MWAHSILSGFKYLKRFPSKTRICALKRQDKKGSKFSDKESNVNK